MDISGVLTSADSFQQMRVLLDLVPDLEEAELRSQLTDRSRDGGRVRVGSILAKWLPNRLAAALVEQLDADQTIAELPRRACNSLTENLKRLPMKVTGTVGFNKAEVTAGGVMLKEVDPRTMESRLAPGLFIAGEVLDVDGPIGGFNFQAAFSTGRAAGIAASKR
jgi:predicted Rossmann fold flavoprotein